MNDSQPGQAPPIGLTDGAARRVGQLMESKGAPGLMLRVYIQGGGCSGFQYGFTFEEQPQEDDMVVARGDVRLVVDPLSLQYLMGAEVDYKEDLQGARFLINNPNASTTCGCGASFMV